jgi:predicted 2-oxoglutarate/Fe(II)-dependent dioxygenase YbiX
MTEYNWISDDIFTLSGFLEPVECISYIDLGESLGFEDAPIETFLGAAVAKDVRDNALVVRDDSALAREFWRRSELYIPRAIAGRRAVGINERFRFYRYDPGRTFRWHRDGAFERPDGERSRLTFMVYLNDDYEGGETRYEGVTIKPITGMALLFAHRLLHEGSPVTRGRKYVLRTDVMYSG